MKGCGTNKYNPNTYFDWMLDHYWDGDIVEYIHSEFDEETANALIKGISLNSDLNNGLKNEEDFIEFIRTFGQDESVTEPVKEHKEITYANDEDTSDLTAYSTYTEHGGVRVQYERMVNTFKQNIIERTLLKDGKLINPESISENLHNYKLEILRRLYQYIEPGKDLPNLDTDASFTRFVKRVLYRVNKKSLSDNSGDWNQYVDDYVMLLNFDKLLTDEIDYITIKPEFAMSGTYGKDMYVSTGPFNYKDRWSTYSETAGTEDYTSSFVKLLLDYFKDSNNRSITLARFQAVSGQVIEWVENSGNAELQELLYSGLDDAVSVSDNNSKFSKLLDAFIKNATVTSEIKSAAKAINDNIFKNGALDNNIRKIFGNQFITSVRYAYLGYRLVYDPDSVDKGPDAFRFVSDLLESDLINRQVYSLQRIIKNRVYQLRNNPQLLQELIDKYGIKIDATTITINSNNTSTVKLTDEDGFKDLEYKVKTSLDQQNHRYTFGIDRNTDNITIGRKQISNAFIKSFIEDVTGLVLPQDFVNVWATSNPGIDDTIWDAFSRVAFVVLTASSRSKLDPTKNLYNGYEYLYRGEELKLYQYYYDFKPLANFYSVVLGAEYATVVKNSEGNNLPTSQLRTSVFDVKREIYRLLHTKTITERSNLRMYNMTTGKYENVTQFERDGVLGKNVLVLAGNAIGTIATRAETKIDENSKISTQLLPGEVMQEAIAVDFYSNLFGTNTLIKNKKKKQQVEQTDTSIWIQPIAYSDKRTHYIVEFKLNNITLSGKKIGDLLKVIADFDPNRQTAIKLFEEGMRDVRRDKYEKQALNVIERFSATLGWGLVKGENESVLDYFKRASLKLKEFSLAYGKNAKSELQKRFGEVADLYVSDYNVLENGEITFNITLAKQLKGASSANAFAERMKREKCKFIRDLMDCGFTLDPNTNPSWKPIFKEKQKHHGAWFDPTDGSMKLFIAKKDGVEFTFDWTDLNNIDWNTTEFELNPILEGFFYADSFLSGQFNDLIFGDVNGYKAKHERFKLKNSDDLFNFLNDKPISVEFSGYLDEDESSRLTDMAKRTVSANASKIYFAQGLKYGINSNMKLMVLNDIQADVFNFIGHKDRKDAQDGGAFCNPIFSREQNVSLIDRRVGDQKKKTFANWLDRETGTGGELKFAEYVLTNEMRRLGCEVADFSFENLHKLMNGIENSKIGQIDFKKYYDIKKHLNEDGENITFVGDLYRYNLDLLMHEKLVEIKQDENGIRAVWQYYNEDGTPFVDPTGGSTTHEEYLSENTIYGIDQLFGGAYCEVWNDKLGKFVWSEANLDLLHIIVAEEDLKDSFIALAVNGSAIKTGARNVNDPNILKYGNTSVPKWFEASTLHYGIQMNPDHDIEDTRGVREMTQMISALVQNGYLMGDVNEIYEMIGSVALDSVKAVIDAVDANDETKIYQIIGEALIKAFDTNQKDVLGLAQSFVAMANRDLANGSYKTRIPFSANTIKGSFQATITSFLNKDAIRRRFAGLGAIQTPSYGGVQYFPYTDRKGNTKRLNWVEFCKAVGGRQNAISLTTDLSWNGMSFNNRSIVPIAPEDIKLNDTIVYRDGLTTQVAVINTPTKLYDFKYRNPVGRALYNWTVKPRNFSGSEIMLSVGLGDAKKQYSIYDMDLVRIIDDLSNLTSEIKKSRKAGNENNSYFTIESIITLVDGVENKIDNVILTNKGEMLLRMIANQFGATYAEFQQKLGIDLIENPYVNYQPEPEGAPLRALDENIFKDSDLLEKIFLLAKWNINNELLPTLSKISRGEQSKLKVQEAYRLNVVPDENDECDISMDEFHPLQVGLGKLSAQKLGLQSGDTINDVFDLKQEFFRRRIKKFGEKPQQIANDFYDVALYEADGTPTLVMFGGLDRNSERLNQTIDSTKFKVRGSNYWKNGVDFGSRDGKYFKEYVDELGKSWNVVVVDNWDAFNDLRNNGQYVNEVFNYTTDNFKDLVRYQYRHNFSNGTLVSQIGRDAVGRPFVEQMEDGDLYLVDENAIDNLNKAEQIRQKRNIDNEANKKWEAFQLQLQVIIDRIPSQSMQSFTSADVVMLLDTEENALVMSAFLAWLQGSDFDIDKGFIMTYEISDDGKIVTPSKLDRYYSAVDIFELPLPNKKKFNFTSEKEFDKSKGDDYTFITLNDVKSGRIPIQLLQRILLGSQNVVFSNEFDVPENIPIKNRIIERVRLHQSSANLPSAKKTAGYRNRIVYKINKMLRDPITQGNLNLPVDEAMNELKTNIPDPEYTYELYRTWDNPATKYRIQRDNMVGRDVIGISAVSLKAFFALTTYSNNIILNLINLAQEYRLDLLANGEHNVELGNRIISEIQKICFDAKFIFNAKNIKNPDRKTGIATISNLRFTNLLKFVTEDLNEIKCNISLDTPRLTTLKAYKAIDENDHEKVDMSGTIIDFKRLIKDLDIYANGTYASPKDANMVLSGYTSLATDNAKELKLAKMNATSQFADLHTHMTITGSRPKDVISFMASPAFNIIARYSERSVLDPNTAWFSTEKALDFVLDRKTLPAMNDVVFKKILTTYIENQEVGTSLFNKAISKDGNLIETGFNDDQLYYIYREAKRQSKSAIGSTNYRITDMSAIRSAIESLIDENSDWVVDAIYSLLRVDPKANEVLLRILRTGVEKTKSSTTSMEDVDPELLYEQQFYDDIDDTYNEEDAYYDADAYFEAGELSKADWINAYRYVKNYLIPKNKALLKIRYEALGDNPIYRQYMSLEKILKATKEQQMLGSVLGINGGLDTDDYSEYKNVRKVERFVNDKYIQYLKSHPNEHFERFDFVKFLDKDNIDYRDRQIRYYNKVADTFNLLDVLISVPHFYAMLQMIPLNRKLLQRSVALKIERELADKLVRADKQDQVPGFNQGDTKVLNPKEWRAVRNYVSDLLILKWFEQQPDLRIKLPIGAKYYIDGMSAINESRQNINGNVIQVEDSISLSTLDGLATFKSLMDNYIIPELKKTFPDNDFLRDLLIGNLHNNTLDRLQIFYRLSFDVSEASKNSALQLKYENISKAFNEVSKQYLPLEMEQKYGRWKIGDLFFLYNLYVHKDGFTSQAFTRLFEDSNTASNKFSFNKQYYEYLSKLDSGEIDYKDLFATELGYNANPNANTANDFLNDLRIRLADFPNAKYHYNIESEGSGTTYGLYLYDKNGNRRKVNLFSPKLDPSDYTLWFPFKTLNSGLFKTIARKELGLKYDRVLKSAEDNAVSSTVIRTIINRINELTATPANPEPIKIISEEELTQMYESNSGPIRFSGPEDFARTKDAPAFIYNGTIYVNLQHASIDSPVHEFLHIILAAMKGNSDVNIKRQYYRLVNEVVLQNPNDYEKMKKRYGGRRDSDIKEEVFVDYLAKGFATTFMQDVNKQIDTGTFKESDLIDFTINAINSLFGSEVPADIEALALGNTTVRDIFSLFGNNLPGMTVSQFAEIYLPKEELIRNVKAKLFSKKDENNKLEYGEGCL